MWDVALFESLEPEFEIKSGVRARRRALFSEPLSGSILEVGAGTGSTWVSGAFDDASRFPRVVMVEPDPAMRARVEERLREEGGKGNRKTGHIEVLDRKLPALGFEDEEFDVVACFFMVSHLDEREAGVKEVVRVLKKGGTLLIMDHGIHYRDSAGKVREHKNEPSTNTIAHEQALKEDKGDGPADHPTDGGDHAHGGSAEHTHGEGGDHDHSHGIIHDQSPMPIVDLFAAIPELTMQGESEEFVASTGRSGPIRCVQVVFKKT